MKKLISLSKFFIISLILTGCFHIGDGEKTFQGLLIPSIENGSSTMVVGNSQKISVMATYSDNSQEDISSEVAWKITDETVVKIDGQGILSALAEGETQITLSYNELSLELTLNVIPSDLSVVSLEIDTSLSEVIEGSFINLSLLATMSDATQQDISAVVKWESSNTEVIAVSEDGVINPLTISEDPVSITATFGELTAEKAFTVKAKSKTIIAISPRNILLSPGRAQELQLRQMYDNGQFDVLSGDMIWSIQNADVASVDESGVLKALDAGRTSVNVIFEDEVYSTQIGVLSEEYYTNVTTDLGSNTFYESDLAGKEIDVSSYLDYTSRNAFYSGKPELKISFSHELQPTSSSYLNTTEIVLLNPSEGTFYSGDEEFYININGEEDEENVYLDFLTIDTIGRVGGYVAGSYAYWSCDWDVGCTYVSGEFVVDRKEDLAAVAQGSIEDPMNLGSIPLLKKERPFTIPEEGFSYYVLGVTPDVEYNIDISTSTYYNITVYSDAGFTGEQLCNYSAHRPECAVTPTGEKLYIRIGKVSDTNRYYFDMTIEGWINEGSEAEPKDILTGEEETALLQAARYNSGYGYSYYRVPVKGASIYSITAMHSLFASNSARIYLYSDKEFSSSPWGSFYSNGSRQIITSVDQEYLYVMIRGDYNGSYVSFSMTEKEFVNVGSLGSPSVIDLVDNEGDSVASEVGLGNTYFTVNLNSSEQYAIQLSDMVDNGDLFIYSNPLLTSEICRSESTDTDDELCELSSGLERIYIVVSGANAINYGGTTFDVYVYPYIQSQGTFEEPVSLGSTPLVDVELAVSSKAYSYYSVDVLENTAYTFSLEKPDGISYDEYEIEARLYQNSDFSSEVCNLDVEEEGDTDNCNIRTSEGQSSLYIRVGGDKFEGETFLLGLKTRIFEAQGSIATPVDLGRSISIGRYSEVDTSSSFFKLSGQPGKAYEISLTSMFDNLDLSVFSDAFSTQECSSNKLSTTNESCIATVPAEGTLFVMVSGANANTYSGSDFYISAIRSYSNEGLAGTGNAISLPAAPFTDRSSSVGRSGNSYYQTAVEIGKEYMILVDRAVANGHAYLYAYSDADFTSSITCSNTRNKGISSCITPAMASDTLFIRVSSSGTGGLSYKLAVLEKPANQGTLEAPVPLGSAPFLMTSAQVSSAGTSYYSVDVEEYTSYRISLNGSYDVLNLDVFSESSYSSAVACSSSSSYSRICDYTTLAGETTLFLKAAVGTGSPEQGALFGITVTSVPVNQGTSLEPFTLDAAPLIDQVIMTPKSSTDSYYTVPVNGSTEYSVIVRGGSYSNRLYVFDGESFQSTICYNYTAPHEIYKRCDIITSAEQTQLFVRIDNYYSNAGEHARLTVEETP